MNNEPNTTTTQATGTEEIQLDMTDMPTPQNTNDIDLDVGNSSENSGLRLGGVDEVLSKQQELAVEMGIDLSQSGQELVLSAAFNMSKAKMLLIKSGLELISAKQKVGDGHFKEYLEQSGIRENRAYEAVNYAKLAAQLDKNQRESLLLLPKKAALLLGGNVDPEVVEFLLDESNLEQTKKMRNKRELSELARALTESDDERERYQKENQELHAQIKAMEEAQEAHIAGSEYPIDVVTLRKEGSVLADEAIASLSSIRTYVERYDASNAAESTEERKKNDEAALYPALANVGSIMNIAQQLFGDICEAHNINSNEIPNHTVIQFADNELALIEAAREHMLARKGGKAIARQTAYGENGDVKRPKGRQRKPA